MGKTDPEGVDCYWHLRTGISQEKRRSTHTHFYLKSDELLAGSYPTKSGQGGVRESRFLTDTVDF